MDYQTANDLLGNKLAKTLKYATQLVRRADTGAIVLVLHDTDIITYHPDNTITLETDGWATMFTKERMHEYLSGVGMSVGQDRGRWYIVTRAGRFAFFDGVHIDLATGAIRNPEAAPDDTSNASLEKLLKKLIGGLDIDAMRAMTERRDADCWMCRSKDESAGHLWQHLHNGAINGTLILRAYTAYSRGQFPASNLQYDLRVGRTDEIFKCLRLYFRERLRVGVFTVSGLRMNPEAALAKRYGA